MGIFGKTLADLFIDTLTGSDSSESKWLNPVISEDPYGGLRSKESPLKTLEKLETVFMDDVEVEGKKRGYERAAAEYDAAFERVEKEYLETKKLIEQQLSSKDSEVTQLIAELKKLERCKEYLEQEIENKSNKVADKYDLPISTVSYSVGSVVAGKSIGVLDLIYHYKNKKLQESEAKGYAEARSLYKRKIRELKDNLERLKSKGTKEIQDLTQLIANVLKEISDAEAQIAELEIALNQ